MIKRDLGEEPRIPDLIIQRVVHFNNLQIVYIGHRNLLDLKEKCRVLKNKKTYILTKVDVPCHRYPTY